jgi:hypothetical protein
MANKKIFLMSLTYFTTLSVIIMLGIISKSEANRFISLSDNPVDKIKSVDETQVFNLGEGRRVASTISTGGLESVKPSMVENHTKEKRKVEESDGLTIPMIEATLSMNNLDKTNSQNVFPLITKRNQLDELSQVLEESSIKSLQLAIKDMINTYGSGYPKGEKYLTEIEKQLNLYQNAKENQTRAKAAYALFKIRREALLSNPVVCNNPILFVVRNQWVPDHGSTHTVYTTGKYDYNGPQGTGPSRADLNIPGGAIKMIDLRNEGKITTIINTHDGFIHDQDVHWDGTKIIFSWKKNCHDNYHIYEININGTGLKQLTFLKDIDDINPLYLPDDNIVFSSSRELKYIPCNRHRQFNIYRMDADGANINQITKNHGTDKAISITPDGRIVYDRYYYVDRDSHNTNGTWTVNPDGTNSDQYWGNHTETPDIVVQLHIIPGTQKAVAIFGSCYSVANGILALIDRRLGVDGQSEPNVPQPVIRTWPSECVNFVRGATNNDGVFDFVLKSDGPNGYPGMYYQDPYPLNDKYFLVSRMTSEYSYPHVQAIFLVDIFGNEILLHKEYPGCFAPMLVTYRTRPLVRTTLRNFENKAGYFYVQDVYKGLVGISRGTVKFLRVVEVPEKRYWASGSLPWHNYSTTYPGISWHDFNTKRILGTVPVEEDGSAYFEVPSNRFVYFQLLDDKGMMIQSMRSSTVLQSGELKGCIGCHENRLTAPFNRGNSVLQAIRKPPEKLNSWYGEPRGFNYIAEVQPVFDKHCVKCHDFGTKPGEKLNLARDRNVIFNTSYNELWRKRYIIVTGAGPCKVPSPKSWGSHASPLVDTIQKGHQGIELSKEEFDRIVTWIDLNAVYYGSFASAYPENRGGHSPLSPVEEDRLSELTGINMDRQYYYNLNEGPLISFDRPAISPILSGLRPSDKKYKEALSIIEKGKARFSENPDSDMPGFKIRDSANLWHENMYQYLHWIEMRNRSAISEGRKIYDKDQPTFNEWIGKRFTVSK